MSPNASSNSSDGASAAASHLALATSPFSPHANALGPTSNLSLGTSNRIHAMASDRQSLSSRASSFASGHDHPTAAGSKAISATPPSAPSFPNPDSAPSSAGFFSFNDRIRNSSDHSRQSSGGAISNFSATSAAAVAARRTQSPLPHHLSGRNGFPPPTIDSLAQSQSSSLNPRSPTSLVPPYSGDVQQRRLSSSFAVRTDSPSLAPSAASTNAARPPFGRQSFSDGPSGSATNLLSADLASTSMDARHGSFSGTFPVADAISPSPAHATTSAAGQPDAQPNPQPRQATPPAPTTGPLSASDPRTQLLVSNLPYRVRWQDLKDLFRKAGTVLRADVSLSADNRSRGYGTVLMATEQDAIKAADMLGGFTWQGRTLDVRVDRSGTLVGVAGSAVMPTIPTNGFPSGALPSPNTFTNGQMSMSNPSAFALDSSINSQQFLGVPSGFGGAQAQSPGSYSANASPSPLSPLARAADHSHARSTRASFSAYSDAGLGGGGNQASEFERAMLQGQGPSGAAANATPNHQRPSSNFDAGLGGQPQHRAVSAVQSLGSNHMGSRRGSEVGGVGGIGGGASPVSSLWGSGTNDAASLYSQNAGGSSVPTGFPGATAMAPWPAGPGSLGGNAMASMQSQPFNSQMPTTSYAGRVLFVGNLPFHCQWQDLKDLFRAAGNIQRADVAIGPDGRSRGFGTVLFATQEDAQNAVRLYHGYEYSGRTLKVHFDRFAAQNGPAIGTPGNPAQYTGAFAAAALPSHMTNNVRAPAAIAPQVQSQSVQGGFGQHTYPMQHQQQRIGASLGFVPQQQGQASYGQGAFQHQNPASLQYGSQFPPSSQLQQQQQQQQQQRYGQQQQQPQQQQMVSGFSAFGDTGRALQGHSSQQSFSVFGSSDGNASERRGSTAKPFGLYSESGDAEEETESGSARDNNYGMSITLPANGGFGAASSYLPSDLMSPGLVSPPAPTQVGQNNSHPGRIQLPATNFANTFAAAADQMSPMSARMQVPMTPGMPGFTFHQVPETPPLYPHFLSPGLGPFSPTVGGSSQMGGPAVVPQNVGNMGGYMNAAPGAPVHAASVVTPGAPAGYNPMFPMTAAYGVHPQQQQPATPHWSQTSGPRRGGANRQSATDAFGTSHNPEADEVVDDVRANIAKTPGAGPRRPSHADTAVHARRASDGTPGAVEPSITDGYPFPLIAAGNVAHLTRRASTNSPAGTPLAGPTSSTSNAATEDSSAPSNAVSPSADTLVASSAEELANTIARLSVKGRSRT
ncbi:uncharacterized protein UTRI_03297_B [Ustilago trichophora]|uniref:RRM domain-containing protein n=1 Tax=Ustilago trichophora TaxID=86804 RepID=A0A5C3E597_9BASI|nr:uncharacterized protein UTRI_03297_B [Ustilago trichophora]